MTIDPFEDTKRVAGLPQVRDIFGYNASIADDEAELAARRYEYALEQRDKLNERIRFGCLTLNAASLIALASLIFNKGQLVMLGLRSSEILSPTILFGIGLAFGAVAIWSNGLFYIGMAAKAFEYRSRTAHRKALFQAKFSHRAEGDVTDELEKPAQTAPDFGFSKLTNWLTNISGFCWLVGLACILVTLASGLQIAN
jgi:hypothetical protein